MATLGFDGDLLASRSMRGDQFRMFPCAVALVLVLDVIAGTNASRCGEEFVPGTLELILMFEPLHDSSLQSHVMAQRIQVICQQQVRPGWSVGNKSE